MASIRANLFTLLLRRASGYRPTKRHVDLDESVASSRRSTRLITLPQLPGTRAIPANIPGVDAEWHVGRNIRDDVRLVYFHGGAYCAGSNKTHRHFTSMLAKKSGIPVLSVNYRLAPEHPFPAAFDDAAAAYEWAKHNGPRGPSDVSTVVLGGDSAGGGLSTALAMQLRDTGKLLDGGLLLLSPWMDVSCSSGCDKRIGHLDPMLSADHARVMGASYAGEHDVHDPRISPLNGDFSDLPPMFVAVGGREVVLDEIIDSIEKARNAGVDVTVERNEEMFHVWPLFYHLIPEGRESLERMVDWLRWKFPQK